MKSYLDLVAEYGRIHKQKNRLTVICIAISVMLVTAIFSMVDVSIQAQVDAFIHQAGNFHAILTGIRDDAAAQIAARKDVRISSFLGMAEDVIYQGKELVIQSSSEPFAREMNLVVTEGHFPSKAGEALLDRQGLEQFGIAIGDTIEVPFHDGQRRQYRITGTYGDFSSLKGTDAHGLMLSPEGMHMLPESLYSEYFYIQFQEGVNIRRSISEIREEYGLTEDQVSMNLRLLALLGQSDDTSVYQLYLTAAVLFFLVMLAGIFMIASSFNMSILERTQFFGLLRCLGATKKQIRRYIRLEGLRYCLKGIPLGLLAGCVISWAAVYALNTLRIRDLPPMRTFQFSLPAIVLGSLIGFLVVMIASSSPAKSAAKVSPQTAVTGNIHQAGGKPITCHAFRLPFRIDTAMGIRHAFSNKKSMALIGGSFAISIILFLCFSILITFMYHALKPLKPYAPDLSIKGWNDEAVLPASLMEELRSLPDIEKIYGRMFYQDLPAEMNSQHILAALISYDDPQFEWAENILVSGEMNRVEDGTGVLIDYEDSKKFNLKIGDMILLQMGSQRIPVQIDAIVSDVPFHIIGNELNIVCSEKTFTALTGICHYTIIDMQLRSDISKTVRKSLPSDTQLLDFQQGNSETRIGYYAMAVFVYGFLAVIALVALINIVNTINSSVSSRMNHYGVMRAIGMSGNQLKKMVCAEAASYAATGSIGGSILGLLLHRFIFQLLITSNWGEPWRPPLSMLMVTVAASALTTLIAVVPPTRKIERMSIVTVVNAG